MSFNFDPTPDMLFCFYKFRGWKRKDQEISLKTFKFLYSKTTSTTSWPGPWWLLTKKWERGSMAAVPFPIVLLIMHCAFQIWKSMCGILSIMCLIKTKSLLSLCQIKTQQEIKSSCKLGTYSQILGIIVRGVVRV